MPVFAPDTLAQWTGGRWTAPPLSPLTGFAIDTRAVRPGQIFVALKTEQRDGHDFLAAAAAAGASAAQLAPKEQSATVAVGAAAQHSSTKRKFFASHATVTRNGG